jgi:NAD+ kinase
MKIVVIYNQKKKKAIRFVEELKTKLDRKSSLIALSLNDQLDTSIFDADLIISAGGDGTTLKVASFLANSPEAHPLPLLAVNFGRRGYLSGCRPEDFFECLERFANKSYRVIKRRLASCAFAEGEKVYFLNEASFLRYPESQIATFLLNAKGLSLKVRADGLIVATETGSTAYCSSAGGARLLGSDEDLSIVFLAPEKAINPIVVGNKAQPVYIECDNKDVGVAFDGYLYKKSGSFECSIEAAEKYLDFLKFDD